MKNSGVAQNSLVQKTTAQKEMTQNSLAQNSARTCAHRKDARRTNFKEGARRTPARQAVSIVSFFFSLVILIIPPAGETRAQSDEDWFTIRCRGSNISALLGHHRAVVCFDGPIERGLDLSVFSALNPGAYVVMRSKGGDPGTALRLSDILRERRVTVILYDYCLGACADYVFAANRTFVKRNTIVAWNGGLDPRFGMVSYVSCHSPDPKREPRKLFDENGVPTKEPMSPWCQWTELIKEFFQSRGLDGGYIHKPQTDYTNKKVQSALMKEPDRKKVFWMWNPKNYGDYFKSKVSFQDYPQSQREVDRLVAQYKLGVRVVFDP